MKTKKGKMKQEFDFETWYDLAKDEYTQAGFKGLPLDEDAARDAYEDGESPESYIQSIIDSWDGNKP